MRNTYGTARTRPLPAVMRSAARGLAGTVVVFLPSVAVPAEGPSAACHKLFECARGAIVDLFQGPRLEDLRAAVVVAVRTQAGAAARIEGPTRIECSAEHVFTVSTGITRTYEAPDTLAPRILEALRARCSPEVKLQGAQLHARPGDMKIAAELIPAEAARLASPNPIVVDPESQQVAIRVRATRGGTAELRTRLVQVGVLGVAVTASVSLANCGTSLGLPVAEGFTQEVAQPLATASLEVVCAGE